MVRVIATVPCYIDNILRRPGEVFDYNGRPVAGDPFVPAEDDIEAPPVRRRKKLRASDDAMQVDAGGEQLPG